MKDAWNDISQPCTSMNYHLRVYWQIESGVLCWVLLKIDGVYLLRIGPKTHSLEMCHCGNQMFLCMGYCNNFTHVTTWSHCDVIWRHRYRSTLAQVMACCLTAPSHHTKSLHRPMLTYHQRCSMAFSWELDFTRGAHKLNPQHVQRSLRGQRVETIVTYSVETVKLLIIHQHGCIFVS